MADRPDKTQLMDRLRREGRWADATAYRDSQRQRLRDEGVPKAVARERAWELMAAEFPELPPACETVASISQGDDMPDDAADELVERFSDDDEGDIAGAIAWVARYLSVSPGWVAENATSLLAVQIHAWARDDRRTFFQHLLPRALAAQEKAEERLEDEAADLAQAEECGKLFDDLMREADERSAAEARKRESVVTCPCCDGRLRLGKPTIRPTGGLDWPDVRPDDAPAGLPSAGEKAGAA